MTTILNRRRYMGGKALSYDYEVEYLESTGTQYINIPITASKNTFFGIEMGITPTGQNSTGDVIGVNPSSEYYINKYSYDSSTQNVVFASTIGGNSTNGGITILHGTKSAVNISTSGKTVNGTYTALTRQIRYDLTDLRIFASYRNANRYPVKFHFIKVTAGSSLILDLIPVRKGTIGYMYDKVSGQLFGNAGTGNFILGPDKLPYGYTQLVGIKNTSTAYLPISVPLGTNIRYELESMGTGPHFSWNTTGNKEIIIFFTNNKSCYLNGNFSAPSFSTTSRYKIVIDLARESQYARAYIDDVKVRETAVNINSGASVQLFRDAHRGNNLKMTIYAFKAYSGDSLVNNYIPAMRKSDNKVGVYDIAANEFITSPNGVDFVAVT